MTTASQEKKEQKLPTILRVAGRRPLIDLRRELQERSTALL